MTACKSLGRLKGDSIVKLGSNDPRQVRTQVEVELVLLLSLHLSARHESVTLHNSPSLGTALRLFDNLQATCRASGDGRTNIS